MENTPVIEIKNLEKDYGQGRGIFGVSFVVYKSECFGFLGPNGAGKSTTIRHLMGFSKPDHGETLINGENTLNNRDEVMRSVSYLPGEIALPDALSGKEFIDIQCTLKNVVDYTFRDYLINLFKLDTSLLCKEMSLGMKRKLAVVCCFMSDPDIIVMDEPSSGLDPEMQEVFIQLVEKEKKRGKTILMSSHIFKEIDASCDRIAVIKDGKIVSLFKSSELKHKSLKTYVVSFINLNDLNEFLHDDHPDFKIVDYHKDKYQVIINVDDSKINSFIKDTSKYEVIDLTEIKETLEDYFMSFYKEEKTYVGVK